MIEAIIFDVGGVYLKGSFTDFMNKAYKVIGKNENFHTDREVVFDSDFNRGLITAEECFRKLFGSVSDSQMTEIKKAWTSTWIAYDEMIDLVKKLKNNYTLAILSNSDALNSKNYMEKGWYSYFDHLILSHEQGILKPDKRIYEITLEKLQLPAEACLFIDD